MNKFSTSFFKHNINKKELFIVRKLRSSHNPNLLEEPKYTEKSLNPSLSVLQDHVSGTDFLLNSGRLVHWTHSRNLKTHLFKKHYYTEILLLLTFLIYIV